MSGDAERPDRRHPHRLRREAYQRPLQPVFFTMRTKHQRAFLAHPPAVAEIVSALDKNAEINGCATIAWCVMSTHVHFVSCVVRPGGDVMAMARGVKRTTGETLRRFARGEVWQRSIWDRHARNDEDANEQVAYVLLNPVRAGLCRRPEEWPYSEFRGFPPWQGNA